VHPRLEAATRSLRLVAVVLALAPFAGAADVPSELRGTWGLPPQDGKVGLSGSYFSLYPSDGGGLRAHIDFNTGGWDCRADLDVSWNEKEARFEWPNRSKTRAGEPCWVSASPLGDRLLLRIFCPYECTTGEEIHAITLEKMAADRLVPPENVVDTFCSSHDTLRQEFCRPGELQKLIAEGNLAARRRGVLAEGNEPLLPDTDDELVSILDTCRAAGGGRPCLARALSERRDTAAAAVTARQQALAEERRRSEAGAVALAPPEAQGWEGKWHLVSDAMIGTVAVSSCEARGCTLSVDGETNYTFVYADRRGNCYLDYNRLTFVDNDRAFSYVEPGAREVDAEGAGPFANFCRIDLTRTRDGFRVALRGAGCSNACAEAQFAAIAGEYHARVQPSIACPPETFTLAWDEENVCLDPELAALDREMASAYAKARAGAGGAAQATLKGAQRAWLASRRSDCDGDHRRTCLVEVYRRRLQELQGAPR